MDSQMLKTDPLRILNHYHSESEPCVKSLLGELWFLNGKLHRYKKPAAISGSTKHYFWRGIQLTEPMAMASLSPKDIMALTNIEQRQAAMEIYGYERFFRFAKELDRFTPAQFISKYPIKENPMYRLYLLPGEDGTEKVKVLSMLDPSKVPIIRYAIRVPPSETNCRDAVAHSYKMEWDEFCANKEWV